MYDERTIARFWSKVAIGDGDECWLWQSGTANGYGLFYPAKRVHAYAHRLSYVLAFGAIPKGLLVMHSCDVRPCVNPSHLSVGTYKANTADMISKGRQRHPPQHGERNPAATITENHVREIRRRRAAGARVVAISREMGISIYVVEGVLYKRTWTHVV